LVLFLVRGKTVTNCHRKGPWFLENLDYLQIKVIIALISTPAIYICINGETKENCSVTERIL
jgi:hypothetical protein